MTALPPYLQNNPSAASQGYLAHLPAMFNTGGLKSAYQQQSQQDYNQGSALAAAAANQYTQRANQTGASNLGAGFAQASAMIPVYGQQADLMGEYQKQRLSYLGQQAQIGAGLTGDIGRQQGQYQANLADYLTNQQKMQQQQSQFGQTFGLEQQRLAQQGQQFNATNRLDALQLALRAPGQSFSYATNAQGQPNTANDARALQGAQAQNQYYQNLRGRLQSYF